MADQADVETALTALVATALYPNGTAAASAVGNMCRVYRGYPAAPALAADLAAGVVHVCVDAGGVMKNVTRYPRKWQAVAPVPASLTVAVGPRNATFAGSCVVGQLAGVAVNGALFPYAVQASDTPATVASNLAALLRAAGWLVVYAGTGLAVPGAAMFTARVVNGAGALQEIKRQEQEFRMTLWCPDPMSRDAAAPVVDTALANLPFIALPDGSAGRLIFLGSDASDEAAEATVYKRTLRYSVEYPTTLSQVTPAMLFGIENFDADAVFAENLTS